MSIALLYCTFKITYLGTPRSFQSSLVSCEICLLSKTTCSNEVQRDAAVSSKYVISPNLNKFLLEPNMKQHGRYINFFTTKLFLL